MGYSWIQSLLTIIKFKLDKQLLFDIIIQEIRNNLVVQPKDNSQLLRHTPLSCTYAVLIDRHKTVLQSSRWTLFHKAPRLESTSIDFTSCRPLGLQQHCFFVWVLDRQAGGKQAGGRKTGRQATGRQKGDGRAGGGGLPAVGGLATHRLRLPDAITGWQY